jgi:hypothetical protein
VKVEPAVAGMVELVRHLALLELLTPAVAGAAVVVSQVVVLLESVLVAWAVLAW